MKLNFFKIIFLGFLIFFLCVNIIAFFHAYKFTHFSDDDLAQSKSPDQLSKLEKIKILLFGVSNPKQKNTVFPSQKYEIIQLKNDVLIDCWSIKTNNSKGTIIIFHGYASKKSTKLDVSNEFLKMGYNTILVDFRGCGSSEGINSTIGFKEAKDVKLVYDYLKNKGEKNIYLFGTSMGSVAIMKAINDYDLKPNAIILECPFGSMYKAVSNHFISMNVPKFPLAWLLVFWGGIQNDFWAFGHNPENYAKNIKIPTLLMYGEKDDKVTKQEINQIYKNLPNIKKLILFPLSTHESYLLRYKEKWNLEVSNFIKVY